MQNNILRATVIATGKTVEVFKLRDGSGYGLYDDGGKTTFRENELRFEK